MCRPIFNSLTPGRFQWNFVWINFKLTSVIDGGGTACEIVLRWISLDLSNDKSTLVQVMAWCRQATSHYLSQCWPIRPQCVKSSRPSYAIGDSVSVSVLDQVLAWFKCNKKNPKDIIKCVINPSGPEVGIYWNNQGNIMAADAMAFQVARTWHPQPWYQHGRKKWSLSLMRKEL